MELEDYFRLGKEELVDRIRKAKSEKNAVILAHNYQRIEVQEIADFIGDSLGLSKEAARTDADLIVFCGVDFMAETAKILSPDKKVIIPDRRAICPMAKMVDEWSLSRRREELPGALVVTYVNSSAAVKAESDVCCTSANAVEVVSALKGKRILFVPDRNLARYAAEKSGADVIPWDGYCYVHENFTADDVTSLRERFPKAKFVAHPECRKEVIDLADEVASTSGMMRYVSGLGDKELEEGVIVGTEEGLARRLQKEFPDALILPLREDAICSNMKLITLEKVAWSIENEEYEIDIPERVRVRAKKALDRMLELG